jgi:hypothetical protein
MIRTIGPHNPTAKIRILDLLTVGDLSRSPTLDRAIKLALSSSFRSQYFVHVFLFWDCTAGVPFVADFEGENLNNIILINQYTI